MSKDWCSQIQDTIRINNLAIPGTHDAAAWTHYWNIYSSTPGTWAQRKSITEQLELGVRVLDLRIGYAWGLGRWIGMFHGPVYLNLTLQSVLDDVKNFLGANPQEFVILIFQQQGKSPQSDAATGVKDMITTTFGANFFKFAADRILWPTVAELRGKVMVMGRLYSQVTDFCDVRGWLAAGSTDGSLIDAGTTLKIYLQDRYNKLSSDDGFLSMADDNRKKFAKVKAAARANPAVPPLQLLRINHMSYSNLRYQPWESGVGMNKLLRDSMMPVKGVLMLDDADQGTVDYILGENTRYRR